MMGVLCYAPPRVPWYASAGWDTTHDGRMRGEACSCAGWGAMVRRLCGWDRLHAARSTLAENRLRSRPRTLHQIEHLLADAQRVLQLVVADVAAEKEGKIFCRRLPLRPLRWVQPAPA
jgi:hypothetical protein